MCIFGMIFGILYDGIDVAIADFICDVGWLIGKIEYVVIVFYMLWFWSWLIVVLLFVVVSFDVACELDIEIGW